MILQLFVASMLLLFSEIMLIRWIGIEIPMVLLFPNVVLIACLSGSAAGMIRPHGFSASNRLAACALLVLVLMLCFATAMHFDLLLAEMLSSPLPFFLSALILVVAVLSTFIISANLGKIIGQQFEAMPANRAYAWNLAGSLAGVAAAHLVSFFYLPPAAWLTVAASASCFVFKRKLPSLVLLLSLSAVSLFVSQRDIWTPYRKLDLAPLKITDARFGNENYLLYANNFFYQTGMYFPDKTIREELLKRPAASQDEFGIRRYLNHLSVPYAFADRLDDVLILAPGSGNDVAYSLTEGAESIDAVEMDPAIASLGFTRNPNRPYTNPRVHLYVDDARSYLRHHDKKYDLIVFAFLDPGWVFDISSFLRIDNFVYTVESFRSALDHLKDGGVVSISFASGPAGQAHERLFNTISKAIGHHPLAYSSPDNVTVGEVTVKLSFFLFGKDMSSPNWQRGDQAVSKFLKKWQSNDVAKTQISTDDWPFIWLELNPRGWLVYSLVVLFGILLPIFTDVRPEKALLKAPLSWVMFFLGLAFMMLETRLCSHLSLVFGSTWVVSASVIATLIMLAFLANGIVLVRRSIPIQVCFAGLFCAFLLQFTFEVPAASQLPQALFSTLTVAIYCLPTFFAGLIFSTLLRQSENPKAMMAFNLFGLALGGIAENFCILWGFKSFLCLSMLAYAIAFLLTLKRSRVLAGQTIDSHSMSQQEESRPL